MNDNEAILVELRKISAWADFQRKITRRTLIFLAVYILAMIPCGVLIDHEIKTDIIPIQKPDWYDADADVRLGDFDKAIQIGEKLILITPQSPEAHHEFARIYLAAGKLAKAREHYAEAFRLFPSEENEKFLIAIDKRIAAENPKP